MLEERKRLITFWFFLVIIGAGVFLMNVLPPRVESHSPTGWKAPAKERKMKNPVPNIPESRSRGQKIYQDKCASCHGLRGDGRGEMGKGLNPQPTDFTDRHMMREMTDGEIYWKLTTGRGAMPSYEKELTEKERWDLVNLLRSFARPK